MKQDISRSEITQANDNKEKHIKQNTFKEETLVKQQKIFETNDTYVNSNQLEQIIIFLKEQIVQMGKFYPQGINNNLNQIDQETVEQIGLLNQFQAGVEKSISQFKKVLKIANDHNQQQPVIPQQQENQNSSQRFYQSWFSQNNINNKNRSPPKQNHQASVFSKLNDEHKLEFMEQICFDYVNVIGILSNLFKHLVFFQNTQEALVASLQEQLKQSEEKFQLEIQELNEANQRGAQFMESTNQKLQSFNDSLKGIEEEKRRIIIDQKMQNIKQQQKSEELIKKSKEQSEKLMSKFPHLKKNQQFKNLNIENTQTPQFEASQQKNKTFRNAILMGQSDADKNFIMERICPNESGQFFKKYYQEELDMHIVNTDMFEFDVIDEREKQIQQYREIFRNNSDQIFCLWIVVKFERLDIMKNYFMSIYKYVKGLNAPISALVTDFQLSEDNQKDEQELKDMFQLFHLNQIIFIKQNIKAQELIVELKKVSNCSVINLKETIFDEIDPQEMEQFLVSLASKFNET